VAGFGFIIQREGRNAVLDDIGESEQASLFADDTSKLLRDIGIIAAVDFRAESVHGVEEFVGILFIAYIFKVVFAALAEG
jgi:hypothetical protein